MMMNWKKNIVYVSLLAVFFITSCDIELVDTKTFAYELRGIWISNDPTSYSGKLEIKVDRITIKDFNESQTPSGEDSNKRPFNGFTKNAVLNGYSEEGKIFIEDRGLLQEGIPYTLYQAGENEEKDYLLFTFGGRQEIMQKRYDFFELNSF